MDTDNSMVESSDSDNSDSGNDDDNNNHENDNKMIEATNQLGREATEDTIT